MTNYWILPLRPTIHSPLLRGLLLARCQYLHRFNIVRVGHAISKGKTTHCIFEGRIFDRKINVPANEKLRIKKIWQIVWRIEQSFASQLIQLLEGNFCNVWPRVTTRSVSGEIPIHPASLLFPTASNGQGDCRMANI